MDVAAGSAIKCGICFYATAALGGQHLHSNTDYYCACRHMCIIMYGDFISCDQTVVVYILACTVVHKPSYMVLVYADVSAPSDRHLVGFHLGGGGRGGLGAFVVLVCYVLSLSPEFFVCHNIDGRYIAFPNIGLCYTIISR